MLFFHGLEDGLGGRGCGDGGFEVGGWGDGDGKLYDLGEAGLGRWLCYRLLFHALFEQGLLLFGHYFDNFYNFGQKVSIIEDQHNHT